MCKQMGNKFRELFQICFGDVAFYVAALQSDEKWQGYFTDEERRVILAGAEAMLRKSTPQAIESTYALVRFMIDAAESFERDDG